MADSSTPSGWTITKFNVAIDVIEALAYLHSCVPPLVHRDLKSKNVLLSSDMEAKISDFGTSRFRSTDKTITGGVGTSWCIAPEEILGDSDFGPAVDIYSFGMLLTEFNTNRVPYDNVRGSNGKVMSDLAILHRVAAGSCILRSGQVVIKRQWIWWSDVCLQIHLSVRPLRPLHTNFV